MSDDKVGVSKKPKYQKSNNKPNYVSWWLFRTKGTVSEPWPTAEELWNDSDVQSAIKAHNDSVKARNNSK